MRYRTIHPIDGNKNICKNLGDVAFALKFIFFLFSLFLSSNICVIHPRDDYIFIPIRETEQRLVFDNAISWDVCDRGLWRGKIWIPDSRDVRPHRSRSKFSHRHISTWNEGLSEYGDQFLAMTSIIRKKRNILLYRVVGFCNLLPTIT